MVARSGHRTILVVDIKGSSSPDRTNADQVHLREALREHVEGALRDAGLDLDGLYRQDLGDGWMVVGDIPKALVLDAAARRLPAAVREHNLRQGRSARHYRLRVAVHAGDLSTDGSGAPVGQALARARRLVDSKALRWRLRRCGDPTALIVSDTVYQVVRDGETGLRASDFQRVPLWEKCFHRWAWCYSPRGGARRWPGTVRSRVASMAAVLALALVGGAVAVNARGGACPPPTELRIAAAPGIADAVAGIARAYERDSRDHDGCATVRPVVYPVPRTSRLTDLFASRWSGEALLTGPPPDAWLADSTLEVERVERGLAIAKVDGVGFKMLGSVASSPLVVAMPQPMAEALGWPRRRLGWGDLLALAGKAARPGARPVRLGRSSPSTTVGLLATAGLYDAGLGPGRFDVERLRGATPAKLRDVEQRIAQTSPDQEALLCLVGRSGSARADPPTAVFVTQQAVTAYNFGGSPGGRCNVPTAPKEMLAIFHPTEGATFLDYPLVRVTARWTDARQSRALHGFYRHLLGLKARLRLGAAGFHSPDHRWLGQSTPPAPPARVLDLPDARLASAVARAWREARPPARDAGAGLEADVRGRAREVAGDQLGG